MFMLFASSSADGHLAARISVDHSTLSRRTMPSRALVAGCQCVLAMAGTAVAQLPDSLTPPHFAFVRVAPAIYVAYQPSVDGLLHGNQTFVVNDSDVFVFDANFTPAAARATLALLQGVTSKPVRTIVYSHWHNDHVWGHAGHSGGLSGTDQSDRFR
ncbi:MAG TPA: MBL fold metallo-hydrolase [Vicinamibacterales bacterium]|nr:MBL fold metallo-hydrolase [Vicinamibacterales bacterium]